MCGVLAVAYAPSNRSSVRWAFCCRCVHFSLPVRPSLRQSAHSSSIDRAFSSQEYLTSDDTQEASRCLKELEVPHFHHELVYEAILLSLEALNEETENSIVKLLKFFYDSAIITPDQMKNVRCAHLSVIIDLVDVYICHLRRASSEYWMRSTTSAWTSRTPDSIWNVWAANAKWPA